MLLFDMIIDRTFKMDFAQRAIMLGLMAAFAAGYFVWRVARPLLKRPGDKALIYELQQKFPQLKQNLLSAVELGQQKLSTADERVSRALVDATIRDGFAATEKIDFLTVLNERGRKTSRVKLMAGGVVSAVLAIGVLSTSFLNTWFDRNILLGDSQWPQQTRLLIDGVQDGRLVVPRGSDHRLAVEVTEDSPVQQVSVLLEIENPAGRTIQSMKSTGRRQGREHIFVFHNVSAPFRLRATGGDEITDWVDVELVEPPSITDMTLTATLPEYTATEPMLLEGGGPHALLVGSRLDIAIEANKPLSSAIVKHESQEVSLVAHDDLSTAFRGTLPGGQAEVNNQQDLLGGQYELVLRDKTGLANVRKTKFDLTIREDKPPQVRASLLGISGLVVPQAILPTSFEAVDEFGLRRMYFDCSWRTPDLTDADPALTREIGFEQVKIDSQQKDLTRLDDVEVLNLAGLGLQPGANFRYQVAAVDSKPDLPGVGKSREFLLRVVTGEELRADLLRREVEQRRAFLQARDQQLELRTELQVWASRVSSDASSEAAAQQESELIRLLRDQKGIGTTIDRVATRFEEFLVEVSNNRLDQSEEEAGIAVENRMASRFENGIIGPIRQLDQQEVAMATRQLDNCRLAHSSAASDLAQQMEQTAAIQQQVVDRMDEILRAMSSSEDYQELVNKALELKADQQRLRRDIENSLKPDDIFEDDPEEIEDIFDN